MQVQLKIENLLAVISELAGAASDTALNNNCTKPSFPPLLLFALSLAH